MHKQAFKFHPMSTDTTRLLLVRHGATPSSEEDRFAGVIDAELSNEGRRQVRRLADRLAREAISAIVASPLRRTLETAMILAEPHRLAVAQCDALREIAFGRWEGLTRIEVEERYPEEYLAWEADPFTIAPGGGEAGVSVLARALPAIRDIVVAHAGKSVIVVSHKATIRLVLASLLGLDERGYRDRLDQSPAALNVVDFKGPVRARLMLYNDVSHYQDRPRDAARNLSKWWDVTS